MGSTAEYYRNNKPARLRRLKQQTAYMKTKKGKDIRNRAGELDDKLGGKVGDGLDATHNKNGKGKHGLGDPSTNRAEPHLAKAKKKNKLKIVHHHV